MTSYSRDVIRDLVAGTLPWHQTRRIMSAYKDDDRFFKYIDVLQERVGWKDRILLPIGEHLFIVESGGGRVTKCECGHEFGDYRRNWKLAAHIFGNVFQIGFIACGQNDSMDAGAMRCQHFVLDATHRQHLAIKCQLPCHRDGAAGWPLRNE